MSVNTYINSPKKDQMSATREDQVVNNAGGYVFSIDDLSYVKRFLIMGSEGGNFYKSEGNLTFEASKKMKDTINSKGKEVVDLVVEVSDKGLAPKNDPALYVLALCSSSTSVETRRYALDNLQKVTRIPTHLYHFVKFVSTMRGMGRTLDRALENWFNSKNPLDLAYSLTKYSSRDGWSARDILRLARPKAQDAQHNLVYNYLTYTLKHSERKDPYLIDGEISEDNKPVVDYLRNVNLVKRGNISEDQIIDLIKKFKFPLELVPSNKITGNIYKAVLETSGGLTWIIRNLGNLSKYGVIQEGNWDAIKTVCDKLTDEKALKKARIHPITLLSALKIYSSGAGLQGSGTWNPVSKVVSALNDAFYKSFEYLESTGKRYYLGLDCSGSMFGAKVSGMPHLTSAEVGACFAMTLLKTEQNSLIKGYNDEMQNINLSGKEDLSKVLAVMENVKWGSTDCSLPILDALDKKIRVDVFVNITDNETYYGGEHVHSVLERYRKEMGINAKMIVLATSLSSFSIADPNDDGQLDIAGFSSDVPAVISEFVMRD